MKNLISIAAVCAPVRVESAKVSIGNCSHVSKFPFQKVGVMVRLERRARVFGEWMDFLVFGFDEEKVGLN